MAVSLKRTIVIYSGTRGLRVPRFYRFPGGLDFAFVRLVAWTGTGVRGQTCRWESKCLRNKRHNKVVHRPPLGVTLQVVFGSRD